MKKLVFTDEKDFSYEVARNRQNDRVFGACKKESYIKLLDDGLLPDFRRLYPENDFIFQQDGAPPIL